MMRAHGAVEIVNWMVGSIGMLVGPFFVPCPPWSRGGGGRPDGGGWAGCADWPLFFVLGGVTVVGLVPCQGRVGAGGYGDGPDMIVCVVEHVID